MVKTEGDRDFQQESKKLHQALDRIEMKLATGQPLTSEELSQSTQVDLLKITCMRLFPDLQRPIFQNFISNAFLGKNEEKALRQIKIWIETRNQEFIENFRKIWMEVLHQSKETFEKALEDLSALIDHMLMQNQKSINSQKSFSVMNIQEIIGALNQIFQNQTFSRIENGREFFTCLEVLEVEGANRGGDFLIRANVRSRETQPLSANQESALHTTTHDLLASKTLDGNIRLNIDKAMLEGAKHLRDYLHAPETHDSAKLDHNFLMHLFEHHQPREKSGSSPTDLLKTHEGRAEVKSRFSLFVAHLKEAVHTVTEQIQEKWKAHNVTVHTDSRLQSFFEESDNLLDHLASTSSSKNTSSTKPKQGALIISEASGRVAKPTDSLSPHE